MSDELDLTLTAGDGLSASAEGDAFASALALLERQPGPLRLLVSLQRIFAPLVGFEEIVVIGESGGEWSAVASTVRGIEAARWSSEGAIAAAMRGEVVALERIETDPGWRAALQLTSRHIASAIHVPLRIEPPRLLAIGTHRLPGRFTPIRRRRASRAAPLLRQVVRSGEVADARRRTAALERELRTGVDLLERSTAALGVGIAVWARDGSVRATGGRLEELAAPWGSVRAWWTPVLAEAGAARLASRLGAGAATDVMVTAPRGGRRIFRLAGAGELAGPQGGLVLLVSDRTRDVDTERERAEAEIRFGNLFRRSTDGIVIHDVEGRILDANPKLCELLGYQRDELLAMRFGSLVARGSQEAAAAAAGDLAARGEARYEIDFAGRDGRSFPAEVSAARFEIGQRQVVQGLIRDITERRQVEAALVSAKDEAERANRAKSDFLATMSHELRTPLNVIVGMTELALDEALPPSLGEPLAAIRSSAEALVVLIEDLLDIARIEAGRLELHPHPTDLPELVEKVCRPLGYRARAKGLTLDWRLDDVPRLIEVDSHRLRQVLLNLVSNAIKFTEAGGVRVVVAARSASTPKRAQVRFEVVDTGIGFDESSSGRIFERFTQLDAAGTRRRYGGVGLGLSISRALVERMGGTVEVASTPGLGSNFRIDLEVEVLEAANKPEVAAPGAGPGAVPGALVLIVDDNPDNRQVASRFLEGAGYLVESVPTGEDAVERATRAPLPALVLMDVEMPGIDGFEATRRIRERLGGRALPIMALTAHAVGGFRERCLAAGMDDYLPKPITRSALLSLVARRLKPAEAGADAPVRISVDPDIADLVPGFVARARAAVQRSVEAFASGDFEAIRKAGHDLKGSGSPHGLPEVSRLGAALEDAARRADRGEVDAALVALRRHLARVVVGDGAIGE